MKESDRKETNKVVFDEKIVRYFNELENAEAYAEKFKLTITDVEIVTVAVWFIEDMNDVRTTKREEQALEFKKEYQKLCEKFNMELANYDVWGDGIQSIEVLDKESGLFHLNILD